MVENARKNKIKIGSLQCPGGSWKLNNSHAPATFQATTGSSKPFNKMLVAFERK